MHIEEISTKSSVSCIFFYVTVNVKVNEMQYNFVPEWLNNKLF